MMLKSLINQPLRDFRVGENERVIDPAGMMNYLNKEIISASLEKHITMFYAVIDCESQTLTYCVAGQYPSPVLISGGSSELLKDNGFPLGLFDWATFSNRSIAIRKDFKIAMVSDGWLESIKIGKSSADEAYLLNFSNSNPISLSSFINAADQDDIEQMPMDDITVFIVSRELD